MSARDERHEAAGLGVRLDEFGTRARAERLRQGLSLPQAAGRMAGVMSAAMLGHIERGQRRPSLGHALAVADALAVPLSSLLGETAREVADLAEFVGDVVEAIDEVFAEHKVRGLLHPAPGADAEVERLVSA